MKKDFSLFRCFPILLFTLGLASSAKALTPMEFYNSLVAGGDDPGYRDGSFAEARFNQPAALVFNNTGNQIFVADSSNNCVRLIHLDQNNLVETLAGSPTPGKADGTFSQCSFTHPTSLAFISESRLVVFDSGNRLLRLLDLKSKTVSTLAGDKPENKIGLIWNMVYQPKENCLYYSESDTQRIKKLNLKSSVISDVLTADAKVPRPTALCLFQDHLYVADRSLPGVYRVDFVPAAAPASVLATLTEVGKGENIQQLTGSGDTLYAFETGAFPLVQILPNYQPVTLTTTWGFMVDNQNPGVWPFISLRDNAPVAFAASPTEAHKLYITLPYGQCQSVLSVKDYRFEPLKYSAEPYDFDYPTTKPPNTFRILVLSDSRMVRSTAYIPGLRTADQKRGEFGDVLYENFVHSLKMNTFSKQLEFMLNREAALKGSSIHYEVLMDAHIGNSLSEYICYDIPPYVKKYDIDLVLGFAGWPGYKNFFQRPLDADGIPAAALDPQYLLKPIADRIPPGAPERFYKALLKKNLVQEGKEPSPGPPSEPDSLAIIREMDSNIRDNMMEMDAQVLKTFVKRIKAIDTPKDHPRNFLIFYAPWWDWYGINDRYEAYWHDLCERNNLNFLDLGPAFYTLEPSFYPTHDAFADNHYNVYGNQLLAYLLSYYLPDKKWIP